MQRRALDEQESVGSSEPKAQLASVLPDPAPSRAGSLPQLKCVPLWERARSPMAATRYFAEHHRI
ncbi:hypothetical protein PS914_05101 [Pseudomonas fluorescens]|uniref:Uncharacterized protein n=1 Tax=Pseudomonas fluorescens TaxID=294 RepID=A0A5E7UGR1_PSEFL|nr:hypothetical protein PS833_05733 [Pseudomonas fluorescens]VVQ10353.1 hypothetical protein PS914_05101 [Pseudomonas fluorescens]